MNDFLKNVGATIVGLFIFGIIVAVISIMAVVGMVSSSESTKSVDKNSVLVLKLDGVLNERSEDSPWESLTGKKTVGLAEMLSAVKKAKGQKDIKGIYIEGGVLSADMAQLQELRNVLADFKKSGKWIVAYGEIYSQGSYYVASVADKLYLNPEGIVNWLGIGGELTYIKDVLAKVGIKVVPLKCGKFKSFTETYTEDRMSEANRLQTERYINGWWQTICKAVGTSRGISVDSLNAYADRMVSLDEQKQLVKLKMVDGLLYNDQIKAKVKERLGIDEDKAISQLSVADMQNVREDNPGEEVAVYYAYGTIVDEEPSQGFFSQGHFIVGKDVCKDLQALADDDDVKAVVLRINSGGGSAYASEQIWHQVELLKKKKPVVVSMGGATASGGYYISAGANYIFAEPTTITGSIGIFGLFPDLSELMTQKIGFKYDEVKTNRNAVFGAMGHGMTTEQIGALRNCIDRGYLLFKKRVADGRKMSMAQVEERAQGRVYLGEDALKQKLVDGLGGLDEAVAKAARLAKLDEYHTAGYPESAGWLASLLDESADAKNSFLDERLRSTLGTFYEPFMLIRTAQEQDRLQARMPFIIKAP